MGQGEEKGRGGGGGPEPLTEEPTEAGPARKHFPGRSGRRDTDKAHDNLLFYAFFLRK